MLCTLGALPIFLICSVLVVSHWPVTRLLLFFTRYLCFCDCESQCGVVSTMRMYLAFIAHSIRQWCTVPVYTSAHLYTKCLQHTAIILTKAGPPAETLINPHFVRASFSSIIYYTGPSIFIPKILYNYGFPEDHVEIYFMEIPKGTTFHCRRG